MTIGGNEREPYLRVEVGPLIFGFQGVLGKEGWSVSVCHRPGIDGPF